MNKKFSSYIVLTPQLMYVDAPYCYRPSWSVCGSVALVSLAKTAEPIKIPFGLKSEDSGGPTGPGNHALVEGSRYSIGSGDFEGLGAAQPFSLKYTSSQQW